MVVKKSEYQNQYKACVVKKNQAAYLENLNLRHERRDREFLHTPICWEELNEEDEKVSSDCSEDGPSKPNKSEPQKEPETKYQSVAEILSDSREKAEAVRKQKLVDRSSYAMGENEKKQLNYSDALAKVPEEEKVLTETDVLNQKPEKKHPSNKLNTLHNFLDDENKKLNKKLALTYSVKPEVDPKVISVDTDHDLKEVDRSLNKDANSKTKTYKQKRNKEHAGLNKIRTSSQANNISARIQNAASSRKYYDSQRTLSPDPETYVPPLFYVPRVRRPDRQVQIPRVKTTAVSPEPALKERPPFIPYGIGDKEDNLATHRTHNVRSSVDVYPPALRAKTRREEEHRRQKEKIRRTRSAEVLRDKLPVTVTQDPSHYESEYRKQFHGYEPKDYEKAMLSHAVIPRSSQVRAVHRGGCLLVHVD